MLALLTAAGWEYFALSPAERPFHPYHSFLRSSGRIGLIAGVAGAISMLFNLTYLARKSWGRLRYLGQLRSWMAFHVFTGLVGASMVTIHSAFAPRSALGILSSAALAIVVAAGAIGRYFYWRIPRSVEGHELECEELRRRLAAYRDKLGALGVDFAALLAPIGGLEVPPEPGGIMAGLRTIVGGRARVRRELAVLARAIAASPTLLKEKRRILPLAARFLRERLWLSRYQELRKIMGSWRFFHRWIAILMLMLLAFHVAIAIAFGDLWILGGEGRP